MKVLFVCSGNAIRSPVGEALLKKFKPKIEVDSAGTNPANSISESAKNYVMRNNSEKYLKQTTDDIDEKELEKYDLIVAMEKRHKDIILSKYPECKNKIVVWNIEDPYFQPAHTEKIFTQIRQNVKDLADSL